MGAPSFGVNRVTCCTPCPVDVGDVHVVSRRQVGESVCTRTVAHRETARVRASPDCRTRGRWSPRPIDDVDGASGAVRADAFERDLPRPNELERHASRAGTMGRTSLGIVGPSDAEPQPSAPRSVQWKRRRRDAAACAGRVGHVELRSWEGVTGNHVPVPSRRTAANCGGTSKVGRVRKRNHTSNDVDVREVQTDRNRP
jgi:hypothetical protein